MCTFIHPHLVFPSSCEWPVSLRGDGCSSMYRTPWSLPHRCSTEMCGATRLSRASLLSISSSGRYTCMHNVHVYTMYMYIQCTCTCACIHVHVYTTCTYTHVHVQHVYMLHFTWLSGLSASHVSWRLRVQLYIY